MRIEEVKIGQRVRAYVSAMPPVNGEVADVDVTNQTVYIAVDGEKDMRMFHPRQLELVQDYFTDHELVMKRFDELFGFLSDGSKLTHNRQDQLAIRVGDLRKDATVEFNNLHRRFANIEVALDSLKTTAASALIVLGVVLFVIMIWSFKTA